MVIKAMKLLQGVVIDEHALQLEISKTKETDESLNKRETKLKVKETTEEAKIDNESAVSNKLLIKNLAF